MSSDIPPPHPDPADAKEAERVKRWCDEHPLPGSRSPSAGMPGSAVAANGVRHRNGMAQSKPCPDNHSRLAADGRMWVPDVTLDLRKVNDILSRAFPPHR
jgi:hypothetical protein